MTRAFSSLAAVGIALAVSSASMAAQSNPTGWRYTVAPYFWMSSLDGDVGVRNFATHVDLSFSDLVDALKFGVAAYGEARYRSYVIGLDGMYFNLGGSKAVAFRGDTGSFSLDLKETMLQPSIGYTFGGDSYGFDALASLRYWNFNATFDVVGPRQGVASRSGSRNWVDAIAAGRFHWMPADGWRVLLGLDGGGGGSRGTWQAYAFGGGDVRSWLTLSAGYRALMVNYDHDNFLFDTTTQGVMIIAAFRF